MKVKHPLRAFTLGFAVALLALLSIAMPSLALAATTWTITSYGDDPNDATTLRGALQAAGDGDTIDLTGLTGAIVLTYGALPVERELAVNANITIIGPGPHKLAIDGNKFSTVVHVFGVEATISGLTIRNGLATVESLDFGFGGGVRNSGTLALSDCVISANSAAGGGHGGSGAGGGIYNLPGKTLTITNCTLSGNIAYGSDFFDGVGGAIWNASNDSADPDQRISGTVTISGSTISDNAANAGAGIFNSGMLTVTNTTLSGNGATADQFEGIGFGGAIYNDFFGSVSLTSSTVSGNYAVGPETSGGLMNLGAAVVMASTLSSNAVKAIVNEGTLNVTNSTVWGNAGDGIANSESEAPSSYGLPASSVSIVNSTIAANGEKGVDNAFSNASLRNTILARNAGGNCYNLATDPANTIASQDHNISDDTTCAVFLEQTNDFAPHTDPGLDPAGLKDNGGPTQTIALTLSSVAVDAIAPADCVVATDQRGVPRPQGTNCDIGAFEATPDFYFSPIAPISADVGESGSAKVQVNSFVGFHSPVTLTATGVPTGISTAFNPNPVTPPSYGSTSSTLTVSIGPMTTPATYSIGMKGSSGALSHSTSVSVTVGVTTRSVTQVVGIDQAAGCIDNSGVSNSIDSKLAQAQADIDAGDIQDAESVLNDLLNFLQAQKGKHITTSCTINGVTFDPDAVLIADVQALLASL